MHPNKFERQCDILFSKIITIYFRRFTSNCFNEDYFKYVKKKNRNCEKDVLTHSYAPEARRHFRRLNGWSAVSLRKSNRLLCREKTVGTVLRQFSLTFPPDVIN